LSRTSHCNIFEERTLANIQEKTTHYTFHSRVGNIADSYFYFTYWYNVNYLLITLVQGKTPADNLPWLGYLEKRGIKHELIAGACLIYPESVEQLFIEEATFTGMNEVYICARKPEEKNIPPRSYPAGTYEFGEELPEGFEDGLMALDALVYLSDGKGVNIAHKLKEEIIYFVRELS